MPMKTSWLRSSCDSSSRPLSPSPAVSNPRVRLRGPDRAGRFGGTAGRCKPAASHRTRPATMTVGRAKRAGQAGTASTCHNDRNKDRTSGLSFQSFDAASVTDHADVAEKMIRRLRSGMMPPVGARRPDAATIAALVNAFETRIDRAAALNPNPGWRPSQRLNRAEYQRAVKDLLAVDVDVNAYLPADTLSDGFDNIADSQTISSTLMEGYLRAASQISRLAVGDRNASADLDDLEGAAHRVADAPRRRRAARHARRPVGAARVPGRRRIPVQDHAAHGTDRRPVRRPLSRRADRSLDRRRARRR